MGVFFSDDDDDDDEYIDTGPSYGTDSFHDAVYGWEYGSSTINDARKQHTESKVRLPVRSYKIKKEYTDLSIAAFDYYMNYREEEALQYINQALKSDDKNSEYWNIKAIILEAMERFDESEKCYDKSLELSQKDLVSDNKVRMLYSWACNLFAESRESQDRLPKLEEALKINQKAIDAFPEHTEEKIDKYLNLRKSIESDIKYDKEYLKNVESLKAYDKNELFTITGRRYYKIDFGLTPGMPLKLVKEPDNKYDRNAIAVYARDEKIGYVANNEYTKFELTSSASELQGKIQDTAQAKFLIYIYRPTKMENPDIQLFIGQIIK